MRFSDYFRGYRRTMTSPLPPEEVARRINEATISRFVLFNEGTIGWARSGRLRLKYRQRFFHYDAKPILAGRIVATRAGSRIDLNFRAPGWAYVFYPFWFAALLMLVLLVTFGPLTTTGDQRATFATTFLFLLGFPVLLHFLGTAKSDAKLEALTGFLARVAQARIETTARVEERAKYGW